MPSSLLRRFPSSVSMRGPVPTGSAYRPARTSGFRADRVTWAIVATGLFAVSALFVILHALYFA